MKKIQDNPKKLILIYRKFKIKNIVFLKIMRKLDIQVKNKLNKICTISIYNKWNNLINFRNTIPINKQATEKAWNIKIRIQRKLWDQLHQKDLTLILMEKLTVKLKIFHRSLSISRISISTKWKSFKALSIK